MIGTEGKREGKTHPSQKNLAEVQWQKSFPHFTADNRQREERERPVPTAQSFKTNETLCVSRVDRGPAQTRHVHRSLHGLSASGTSAVWNRTGSSLLLFLTPSCSGSTGDQMLLILSLLLRNPRVGKLLSTLSWVQISVTCTKCDYFCYFWATYLQTV